MLLRLGMRKPAQVIKKKEVKKVSDAIPAERCQAHDYHITVPKCLGCNQIAMYQLQIIGMKDATIMRLKKL